MVGFILIVSVVILIILWLGLGVSGEVPNYVIATIGLVTVVTAVVTMALFGTISSTPHEAKPEDRSPVVVVDKVDRQGNVYIFTMEDGSQVAKGSDDVVESDTYGAEATIQYGNEYYSWGNFWFGGDWAGDEKVYYTPSNGG